MIDEKNIPLTEEQLHILSLLQYLLLYVGNEVFEDLFAHMIDADILSICESCDRVVVADEMMGLKCHDCLKEDEV